MRYLVFCIEYITYNRLHIDALLGFIEVFDSMHSPTLDARQMVFETPDSDKLA